MAEMTRPSTQRDALSVTERQAQMHARVGRRVKQARLHLNLTQAALAQAMGLAKGSGRNKVSQIEGGTANIELNLLVALSAALQIPVEALTQDVGEDETRPAPNAQPDPARLNAMDIEIQQTRKDLEALRAEIEARLKRAEDALAASRSDPESR